MLEIPEGWEIPGTQGAPRYEPLAPSEVTWEHVVERRGADGSGGRIAGTPESRQILRGPRPHLWSVAVGTRHVERAHQRCVERGIPCSEVRLVDWNDKDDVRAVFAEVGGIVFEVMRVEPKP